MGVAVDFAAGAPAARPLPARPSLAPFVLAMFGTLAAMLAMLAIDQPAGAIAMPVLLVAAYVLWKLPLKVSTLGLLGLVVLFEGLEVPLGMGWESPLYPVARAFLTNLSAVTGIGALRAPLVDILTLGLWVMSLVRSKDKSWVSQTRSVRALDVALGVSAATVIGLDLLGVARGGNMAESFWQLRHLLLFPLRCALLLRALDGTLAELKAVAVLLIGVGVLKSLVGIYFLYGVVFPAGEYVEFTTSHTDTLLFVPLLAMFLNLLVERWSPRLFLRSMIWVPIVAFGMVCNDRRLAYVCLAFAMVATFALSGRTKFKRSVIRGALFVAPFVPFYVAAGWTSTGGRLFWAARLAKSVIYGDPNQGNQPDYRDLENLNVLFTWANNALLPYGFGHKMQVLFPLPDISTYFPSWEYHPHNQYLWILALAGPIGFSLIFMPQVLGLYLCTRAYKASTTLYERVAMLTGIATLIAFFCQVWGDMGTLSWTVTWMAALACAFGAKVALRTGAVAPPAAPRRDAFAV